MTGDNKMVAEAVPDLPINCYNETWRKAQDKHVLEALNMQPPIDLTISDDLKKYFTIHDKLSFSY